MNGQRTNRFGQVIGPALDGWVAPPPPARVDLPGRYCRVVELDVAAHAGQLFEAYSADDGRSFTYLPFEQPTSVDELAAVLVGLGGPADQLPCAIEVDGRAVGMASYLRVNPAAGSVEVGAICYSPALARTTAATEAMFLMADHAFGLGYRRYEWKCDSLNGPSFAAAQRLGFRFEGTFRNALVYKGRSRDTDWLSILDTEWPKRRAAIAAWLDPANFDGEGRQVRPLGRPPGRPTDPPRV